MWLPSSGSYLMLMSLSYTTAHTRRPSSPQWCDIRNFVEKYLWVVSCAKIGADVVWEWLARITDEIAQPVIGGISICP